MLGYHHSVLFYLFIILFISIFLFYLYVGAESTLDWNKFTCSTRSFFIRNYAFGFLLIFLRIGPNLTSKVS